MLQLRETCRSVGRWNALEHITFGGRNWYDSPSRAAGRSVATKAVAISTRTQSFAPYSSLPPPTHDFPLVASIFAVHSEITPPPPSNGKKQKLLRLRSSFFTASSTSPSRTPRARLNSGPRTTTTCGAPTAWFLTTGRSSHRRSRYAAGGQGTFQLTSISTQSQ